MYRTKPQLDELPPAEEWKAYVPPAPVPIELLEQLLVHAEALAGLAAARQRLREATAATLDSLRSC